MEKISIHRALAELKLLDSKIEKGTAKQFVSNKLTSADKIGGVSVVEIISTMKADYQYEKFYDWCIEKHKEGHKVFISEYYMPEDSFVSIWEKEINSSLTKNTGSKKRIEKLWVVK